MAKETEFILSEILKEYRKNNHLTQKEFGEKVGVSQGGVTKWENRGVLPNRETMEKLSSIDKTFEKYFHIQYLKERRNFGRYKNITGYRFGKLTAIKPVGEKHARTIWLCKCDCGNEREVLIDQLTSKSVYECKACAKETIAEHARTSLKTISKFDREGTNILNLSRKKGKNNKSGVKGVSFISKTKKWRADIGYKGENIFLGEFVDKNSAIKARKEAEEKYHKPILDSYKKEIGYE